MNPTPENYRTDLLPKALLQRIYKGSLRRYLPRILLSAVYILLFLGVCPGIFVLVFLTLTSNIVMGIVLIFLGIGMLGMACIMIRLIAGSLAKQVRALRDIRRGDFAFRIGKVAGITGTAGTPRVRLGAKSYCEPLMRREIPAAKTDALFLLVTPPSEDLSLCARILPEEAAFAADDRPVPLYLEYRKEEKTAAQNRRSGAELPDALVAHIYKKIKQDYRIGLIFRNCILAEPFAVILFSILGAESVSLQNIVQGIPEFLLIWIGNAIPVYGAGFFLLWFHGFPVLELRQIRKKQFTYRIESNLSEVSNPILAEYHINICSKNGKRQFYASLPEEFASLREESAESGVVCACEVRHDA